MSYNNIQCLRKAIAHKRLVIEMHLAATTINSRLPTDLEFSSVRYRIAQIWHTQKETEEQKRQEESLIDKLVERLIIDSA
jgi:hypothetical protein